MFFQLVVIPFIIGVISGIVGTLLTPYVEFWIKQAFLSPEQRIRKHEAQKPVIVYKPPFHRENVSRLSRAMNVWFKKNSWYQQIYLKLLFRLSIACIFWFPLLSIPIALALVSV